MSSETIKIIEQYVGEVLTQYKSGHAKEHAYRPALERLMSSFKGVTAINDPKRSAHGNPDFVFLNRSNKDIIRGYAEAKDIDVSLDKTEKTDQMRRYGGYENLFLTNYIEFRFFQNGSKYRTITIGELKHGTLHLNPAMYGQLADELAQFLELQPESIKSGKRLAEIMGAKARRIRDNVQLYLAHEDDERNQELEKMYNMMKELLVHDLTTEKFADMYSQTLVYGLFVARYNDTTPENFDRKEARDLVPASNPFLREFFDHIVGPRFDKRLAYIVDELCEVFSVSDVNMLVHKHLKLFEVGDEKDPIIHFYEDFLREYDPAIRKQMGAYYTPLPVVRFIIKNVDEILKRDFGLPKGLADTSKKKVTLTSQGKSYKKDLHRVQILDPAVGTATFLNEVMKHIYQGFKGQEGRWPGYVEDDLLPRIYGFELMMAPYTIAHLKLGMTLQEMGAKPKQRIGVYLTNTLEEGNPSQPDLFSFGLADVVSHEAEEAAKIKHERPIMVVMGNPPYSISSNNKSEYILDLLKDYKKALNERKINLDDDYIKFIRFAEEMILKNGAGIVAMITNNSYIDGITHRQMRKHLLETFDQLYILDLHGSTKKNEVSPDGTKDENVFAIQQGVAISVFVKRSNKKGLGEVSFAELYGTRHNKFDKLGMEVKWHKISSSAPNYFFVPRNESQEKEYSAGVKVDDLFIHQNSGIQSKRDKICFPLTNKELTLITNDFEELDAPQIRTKYALPADGRDWRIDWAKSDLENGFALEKVLYRPFDIRKTAYTGKSKGFIAYPRESTFRHFIDHENIGLVTVRQQSTFKFQHALVTANMIESGAISLQTKEWGYIFPLYLYHDDGTRTPNFKPDVLKEFTKNLTSKNSPEEILDYIYAVLYSPKYRSKYQDLLKIDFPRIPIPKDDTTFRKLGKLGNELKELHLMNSKILNDYETSYPISGSDEVERNRYEEQKIWINAKQYFGNVPELAWNFYIGGYQPAQKWLKDRKGRKLSNEDIDHYQKIIKVLIETEKLMTKIDQI